MSELPKWLGALIARLLPRQKSAGDHAAQFGKVGGNVTIVHLTLPDVSGPSPDRAPVSPMSTTSFVRPLVRPAGVANEEQRLVLQLIRRLHDSASVYEFMRREFGTHMVINLKPPQLFRVRRYVEAIIQSNTQVSADDGSKPIQQFFKGRNTP